MLPVRAIFFDIGDTLVFDDPPLPIRLTWAARSVGVVLEGADYAAAYRLGEDYSLGQYLRGVRWDAPDSMREAVAQIWRAQGWQPLSEADWRTLVGAFSAIPVTRYVHPGGLELLAQLKARGFVVGAISDWEETLPALLSEMGILAHLDALAVSATVGVTKPDPRLFQAALCQVGADPEATLHVGDWYALDVLGARAAGMRALLFDHAGRTPNADCPRVTAFGAMTDFLLSLHI